MTQSPSSMLDPANIRLWKTVHFWVDHFKLLKYLSIVLSLRARYGTDDQRNAFHGSDSLLNAQREVRFFFQESKHISMGKNLSNSTNEFSLL